jgi:glycosyltransferase involved in cell wall biosynthesis
MRNEITLYENGNSLSTLFPKSAYINGKNTYRAIKELPEILFITSYPERECGIATYSQDLLKALDNKYSESFSIKVCALESNNTYHNYPDEVKYILNTTIPSKYEALTNSINNDTNIELVLIQHEFGFFQNEGENALLKLLYELNKPAIIVFHTVLPKPAVELKNKLQNIVAAAESVIVMTKSAANILHTDYEVPFSKINIIAHGTHLVPHLNKETLKEKYGFSQRKVLSTFGLLSSGKSIETTLDALPNVIKYNADVLFLIIGKTHPGVIKHEGEQYRQLLEEKVISLHLQHHVKFINQYVPLNDLLEYLQLTDIYLFTSKDPNQAVSGTFSYAMSCGCPIISTPIPHAQEVLQNDIGIIIDFQNSKQLADSINRLLSDELLRQTFSANSLQRIVPTAWENTAIVHALLIQKVVANYKGSNSTVNKKNISLQYRNPKINLQHIKKLTTEFGMVQFSKINQPDLNSGYTLDDNARALIAICMHYELTKDEKDMLLIKIYLNFIKHCQQPEGYFLNYVNIEHKFTSQNEETNLADSNGRAIWALGYLISKRKIFSSRIISIAEGIMQKALPRVEMVHSTRAMAFTIKGLYYFNLEKKSYEVSTKIKTLANRLLQMYRHESEKDWWWFESYLTYANSILPEAMLYAWQETGELVFKETAKKSFDFLLSLTFSEDAIKVISNKSWMKKGQEVAMHGEQPIDVAYTIFTLYNFYKIFKTDAYSKKINLAFNWFMGNNHLQQIIYNPCTGGCYDGLEETQVNLNQGAESSLSYLMARLVIEKHNAEK